MGIDTILHSIVLSVLVLPNGFQPLHLSVLDFESSVSCNSTIRVDECLIILTGFWVVHSKVYPHPLKPQSCYSSRELLAYSCSTNNANVAVFSNFGFGVCERTRISNFWIKSSVFYQLKYTDISSDFLYGSQKTICILLFTYDYVLPKLNHYFLDICSLQNILFQLLSLL